MEIPLLADVVIICGLSLTVVLISNRLALPAVVGLLVTGVVIGPHGLGFVGNTIEVQHLAEIGVVFLLFTIGLELSLENLIQLRLIVLLGGGLQVAVTIAIQAILGRFLDFTWNQSIFLGFLVSLSSTAIVLKILQQRAETETPQGRLCLGILIFQDIIVVPMLLFTPLLAGEGGVATSQLAILLFKVILIVGIVTLGSKWLVPTLLYRTARVPSREVFLLGVVLVALGMTWLSSELGLSPALGAFLAGVMVAESEYNHRAMGSVLPFRDLFTSIFFVSIGMLLEVKFVTTHILSLLSLTVLVLLIKFIVVGIVVLILGYPLRAALITAITLSQIGEFSFVLSQTGLSAHLLDTQSYQWFVGVSVLTMTITPFLIPWSHQISSLVMKAPLPQRLAAGIRKTETPKEHLSNHIVIVGFGLNGRNLSRVAALSGISRVIIEMNPETVRKELERGEPIFYGDASQSVVLEHADIRTAGILVIVISDPSAAKRIIDSAKRLNPAIYIIVRTRFTSEMDNLYDLGADEVIPEDYEVSLEIMHRVLNKFMVPRSQIENFVSQMRAEHYKALRVDLLGFQSESSFDFGFSETEMSVFHVSASCPAVGKTLQELDLRNKFGLTVLALKRQGELIENPSAQEAIRADDQVMVIGKPEKIAESLILFTDPNEVSFLPAASSGHVGLSGTKS